MSLQTPDWSRMVNDIVDAGCSDRKIVERLRIAELSPKLLKHYESGGQPVFPRGFALYMLWLEVTGKPETEIPWTDWSMPYRGNDAGDMTLKPRCNCCGQVLRGARGQTWKQLQIHHTSHGVADVTPSWLSPKVVPDRRDPAKPTRRRRGQTETAE
jgi:hypothetical protein